MPQKGDLSITHPSRFWGHPSRFCLYSKTKRLLLRLKLAPFEIEASFIDY